MWAIVGAGSSAGGGRIPVQLAKLMSWENGPLGLIFHQEMALEMIARQQRDATASQANRDLVGLLAGGRIYTDRFNGGFIHLFSRGLRALHCRRFLDAEI